MYAYVFTNVYTLAQKRSPAHRHVFTQTDTQIYAHILACTDIFTHTDTYLAIQIDTHAHT